MASPATTAVKGSSRPSLSVMDSRVPGTLRRVMRVNGCCPVLLGTKELANTAGGSWTADSDHQEVSPPAWRKARVLSHSS
jgi:hypothetical protein